MRSADTSPRDPHVDASGPTLLSYVSAIIYLPKYDSIGAHRKFFQVGQTYTRFVFTHKHMYTKKPMFFFARRGTKFRTGDRTCAKNLDIDTLPIIPQA